MSAPFPNTHHRFLFIITLFLLSHCPLRPTAVVWFGLVWFGVVRRAMQRITTAATATAATTGIGWLGPLQHGYKRTATLYWSRWPLFVLSFLCDVIQSQTAIIPVKLSNPGLSKLALYSADCLTRYLPLLQYSLYWTRAICQSSRAHIHNSLGRPKSIPLIRCFIYFVPSCDATRATWDALHEYFPGFGLA